MRSKILTVLFLLSIAIGNTQTCILDDEHCDVLWVESEYDTDKACVSPEEHKRIKNRLEKSAANMRKAGVLEKHFSAEKTNGSPLF